MWRHVFARDELEPRRGRRRAREHPGFYYRLNQAVLHFTRARSTLSIYASPFRFVSRARFLATASPRYTMRECLRILVPRQQCPGRDRPPDSRASWNDFCSATTPARRKAVCPGSPILISKARNRRRVDLDPGIQVRVAPAAARISIDRCPCRSSSVHHRDSGSSRRRPASDDHAAIPRAPESRSRNAADFLHANLMTTIISGKSFTISMSISHLTI